MAVEYEVKRKPGTYYLDIGSIRIRASGYIGGASCYHQQKAHEERLALMDYTAEAIANYGKLKEAAEGLVNTAVEYGVETGGDYFTVMGVEEAALDKMKGVLDGVRNI